MTPKEKAKELVDKYYKTLTYLESKSKAKQCALITADEIILEICATADKYFIIHKLAYYKEVKQEIEKL